MEKSIQELLRENESRLKDILNRAGIPVKSVIMTRVTVIVILFGGKHAERVASYLLGAKFTDVKIFDDRPSIFHKENKPDWRVTAKMGLLSNE